MTMMTSNYFFVGRGAIAILGPVTTNAKEIVVAAKAQFLRIHGDFSGLDRLQQTEETSGVIAFGVRIRSMKCHWWEMNKKFGTTGARHFSNR
jgi:hypothetical protein